MYFDDFAITTNQGNIIEENYYYSFGLKIAAISSRKYADSYDGKVNNLFLYNGKEMLDDDADLNWYDYGFRSYDPQIGRFMQLDPLTDSYPHYTPYQFAGNDPITNVDLDGLEPLNVAGGFNLPAVGSALINDAQDLSQIFRPAMQGGRRLLNLSKIATVGSYTTKVIKVADDLTKSGAPSQAGKYVRVSPQQSASLYPWMHNSNDWPPSYGRESVENTTNEGVSSTPWVEGAKTEYKKGIKEAYDVKKVVKGKIVIEGCNCGSDVEKYLKTVGLGPGYPWCAAFLNWDLKQNNIKGTGSGRAVEFEKWGLTLSKPAFGSIGVIEHSDGTGHVTIIVGQSADGKYLIGLGGNQGPDQLHYSQYPTQSFKSFQYPTGYIPSYDLPVMNIKGGSLRDR